MRAVFKSLVLFSSLILVAVNVQADGLFSADPKEVDGVTVANLLTSRDPAIKACLAKLEALGSPTFESIKLFETLAPATGEVISNLYVFNALDLSFDMVVGTITMTITETQSDVFIGFEPAYEYTCRVENNPLFDMGSTLE
ncbi:MAG: hypothetical protein KBD78_01345 [Oligoflexales bacterium]|nr:hypothetical protein [Oligoflexales bacterium]